MNDTITTPETPSLTTARSQPQTLEKSTAVESDPVVIEPQPDTIRDLSTSLVNANEQQALSQYPPAVAPEGEMNRFNFLVESIAKLKHDHEELKVKLARHFPALF